MTSWMLDNNYNNGELKETTLEDMNYLHYMLFNIIDLELPIPLSISKKLLSHISSFLCATFVICYYTF